MKILVISPPTFGKHVGGAAKDIFALVTLLRQMKHEVSFYCIAGPSDDPALIEEFKETQQVPVSVFRPPSKRLWRSLVNIARVPAYADGASYVFGQLIEDREFQTHVSAFEPELIIFFCSYGWPVAQFARERGIRSVFRSHNWEPGFFFEALTFWQKLMPFNWIRALAKQLGEYRAAKFSTVIATIPFYDRMRYRRFKSDDKIFVFTLTYLPEALRSPGVHSGKMPLDVFYLGASYLVSFHLRGAQALIEDIAPEVERRRPGAFRFHICGSKLPLDLQKKCNGVNVIYEGYVEDFEAFLRTMDIGAFPVWTGKSMKGKVFESLSRAFPVVIPENCLGGYELKDKEEVLIAESPEEFTQAILSLGDDALRARLSDGAARFAQSHFSNEALVTVLAQVIHSALTS